MNKIIKFFVNILSLLAQNRIIAFLIKFKKRFYEENILKEASNLTFVTVLGFVPFLLFLLFLIPDLPSLNIKNELKEFIISTFLPESANMVVKYINNLFDNNIPMNIMNIIMLIITSYSLFASITGAFDQILKINVIKKTSVINLLLKFFGTLLLGFLIFILLFSITSMPYISLLFDNDFYHAVSSILLPVIMWFILIFLSYFFVPSTRMKSYSIICSSVISSVLWFIMKNGFDWYITNMTRMKMLYGVISSFPIFLFWIFANWVIVLGGVIILSIMNSSDDPQTKKVILSTTSHVTIEDEKENKLNKNIELSDFDGKEIKKIILNKIK